MDSGDFVTMNDPKIGRESPLEMQNKHEDNIDWKMYYPDTEMYESELDLECPESKEALLTTEVYFLL